MFSAAASSAGKRTARASRRGAFLLFLPLLLALAACETTDAGRQARLEIAPLQVDGRLFTVDEALAVASPDVLAVSDAMRDFVALHTGSIHTPQSRLLALHGAIKSDAVLDMRYDPFAEGDAAATFARGTANCLSYAHMFIALAREAGLDARYQWMEVRPEWHRIGERVAVRLHVNVHVKTRDGGEFMIDIDPLSRSEVAGARLMTDEEGLALYHNNLAITALAEERPAEAWQEIVRGLREAPALSQLWVNLGAIYRFVGQDAEAERAYFRALEIDRGDRSAMNNLVVLYEHQGRDDEASFWLDRLARYRDRNPYYHASLGDAAMREGDWDAAVEHYSRARRLQPDDGQLIYSQGVAEYRRGNLKAAERLVSRAIEKASFPVERERYLVELKTIREEQAASL